MKGKAYDYFSLFLEYNKWSSSIYAERKKPFVLPIIPIDFVFDLCTEVQTLFRDEPGILPIHSPCIIVGDLHGHILDLFRVIQEFGTPDHNHYVFLGDIVDRGEFSIETAIIVFLMKIVWPRRVSIIRGNHEFSMLCGQCGFYSQVIECYNEPKVFDSFIKAFSYIPLGALIDETALCVHGGIGPNNHSIMQILEIQRPFDIFGVDIVIDGLIWSDPCDSIDMFLPSSRGIGYLFGPSASKTFIEKNQIKYIIRGHECVAGGLETHFNGSVITVFTASNYCGIVNNKSAVLIIKDSKTHEVKRFPPLQYLLRENAIFRPLEETKVPSLPPLSSRNTKNLIKEPKDIPSTSRNPRVKKPSALHINKIRVFPK